VVIIFSDLARVDHSLAAVRFRWSALCSHARVWFFDQQSLSFRTVLAIGIVVDDAIVVVENVERNIASV